MVAIGHPAYDPPAPEALPLPERGTPPGEVTAGLDPARRIRNAIEAAIHSEIIPLGTEQQIRLTESATPGLKESQCVENGEIIVALRDLVRTALDLKPIPSDLHISPPGPSALPPRTGADGARPSVPAVAREMAP